MVAGEGESGGRGRGGERAARRASGLKLQMRRHVARRRQ